jgi:predicted amidophosphoribosyltransferase
MTSLLAQALSQVQKLSDAEQDAIAAVILAEIADDDCWEKEFAQSQDQLTRLAEKVKADISAGRVVAKGIDEL